MVRISCEHNMKKQTATLAVVFLSVSMLCHGAPMFDPALDKPDLEWCYAGQSTTVIGMPFVPEPVQVTYDGAVYTRYGELAFFYCESLTPVMARTKTLKDGCIPVLEYEGMRRG